MHPELFPIPLPWKKGEFFIIYTYGPIMALGFLLAFFLMYHIAKKRGQNVDFYMDLFFWLILGGLLGAKILYDVVGLASTYREFSQTMDEKGLHIALFDLVNCRRGGLIWYGGVIANCLIIYFYARRHKIDPIAVMDTLAAPLALGLAVGRWGCLMGGCCYGRVVEVAGGAAPWWCVTYPEPNPLAGLPVHATPIYESLASLLIAAAIYLAIRKGVRRGAPSLMWFTLYPLARIIIEHFRGDLIRGFIYKSDAFFVSTSQFIGIVILTLALVGWAVLLRKPAPSAAPAEAKKEKKKGADAKEK